MGAIDVVKRMISPTPPAQTVKTTDIPQKQLAPVSTPPTAAQDYTPATTITQQQKDIQKERDAYARAGVSYPGQAGGYYSIPASTKEGEGFGFMPAPPAPSYTDGGGNGKQEIPYTPIKQPEPTLFQPPSGKPSPVGGDPLRGWLPQYQGGSILGYTKDNVFIPVGAAMSAEGFAYPWAAVLKKRQQVSGEPGAFIETYSTASGGSMINISRELEGTVKTQYMVKDITGQEIQGVYKSQYVLSGSIASVDIIGLSKSPIGETTSIKKTWGGAFLASGKALINVGTIGETRSFGAYWESIFSPFKRTGGQASSFISSKGVYATSKLLGIPEYGSIALGTGATYLKKGLEKTRITTGDIFSVTASGTAEGALIYASGGAGYVYLVGSGVQSLTPLVTNPFKYSTSQAALITAGAGISIMGGSALGKSSISKIEAGITKASRDYEFELLAKRPYYGYNIIEKEGKGTVYLQRATPNAVEIIEMPYIKIGDKKYLGESGKGYLGVQYTDFGSQELRASISSFETGGASQLAIPRTYISEQKELLKIGQEAFFQSPITTQKITGSSEGYQGAISRTYISKVWEADISLKTGKGVLKKFDGDLKYENFGIITTQTEDTTLFKAGKAGVTKEDFIQQYTIPTIKREYDFINPPKIEFRSYEKLGELSGAKPDEIVTGLSGNSKLINIRIVDFLRKSGGTVDIGYPPSKFFKYNIGKYNINEIRYTVAHELGHSKAYQSVFSISKEWSNLSPRKRALIKKEFNYLYDYNYYDKSYRRDKIVQEFMADTFALSKVKGMTKKGFMKYEGLRYEALLDAPYSYQFFSNILKKPALSVQYYKNIKIGTQATSAKFISSSRGVIKTIRPIQDLGSITGSRGGKQLVQLKDMLQSPPTQLGLGISSSQQISKSAKEIGIFEAPKQNLWSMPPSYFYGSIQYQQTQETSYRYPTSIPKTISPEREKIKPIFAIRNIPLERETLSQNKMTSFGKKQVLLTSQIQIQPPPDIFRQPTREIEGERWASKQADIPFTPPYSGRFDFSWKPSTFKIPVTFPGFPSFNAPIYEKSRQSFGRGYRYTPSLAAIGLGITSMKMPKGIETGFVLRPIIKIKRRSRRK